MKNRQTVRLALIATKFLIAWAIICLISPIGRSQITTPRRVLVLYWDNKDFPGNIRFDESFKLGMQSSQFENFEYYPEYYEYTRFPDERYASSFRNHLREKYSGLAIDAVVATADPALRFLLKTPSDLFPNVPIVTVLNESPGQETVATGSGVTGIINQSTHRQTLDLALKLHPGTDNVFVVSGSLEHDRRFEIIAREELRGLEHVVQINYLTDLPLNELIARTRSLPPRSVILYVWQQALNERGRLLQTYDVLNQIAPGASAPIYGMGAANLGNGIVGGYLQGPVMNGRKAAELVVRIMKGTRAQDIPFSPAPTALMFDWRELKRWGISESSLPPGSVISFRQLTFWEHYKWQIVGVLTVISLQAIFIGVLLVERKRRRRAKDALDQLNLELEERITARTAALDSKSRELETFAYTVAHDLKAPLRGIDGYTRLLLEDHLKDLNPEAQQFLTTIHNSSEEMSQLIDDLLAYSRLERREFQTIRLELGPLVSTVVQQKTRELNGANIEFVVDVNGASVVADSNGLAQSLNNYLDNAVKFTSHVPRPCVEIGCDESPEKVKLWVRDNGIGFDMKYHDQIFGIFQRLNSTDDYPGTGVGLAIVRKAMERMGGRAWAESEPGHGATFYLEIPR